MLSYFVVLFFSFFLVWLVKIIAKRKSIIDIPNERSSHSTPTPRGGGIAVAIIWFVTISILYFRKEINSDIYFALLSGLPLSVIGLIDDILTISPRIRLFVQIFSATMAIIFLGGLSQIDIGINILNMHYLFSIIAIIGIVWFTNLFNFLDGIDGYIGSEVIFISISMFLIYGVSLPLYIAAAVAGFLLWNWQPAKIFMGDVGSTLLGFTLGVFLVYYQKIEVSSIIIWLIISSLFWFDATITLYRRWRNGEIISRAHKKHAYQRIVQSGYSHQKTVVYSMLINLPIFCFAWFAHKYPTFLLIILIINIAYLFLILKLVDKKFSFNKT